MLEEPEIDPTKEEVVPLQEFRKILGQKYAYTTILQWVREGRLNRWSKTRHKLEAIQMPWGLGTSKEAYWRFIKKLNES